MHMRVHLRIAGQVFVLSCAKVFEVIVPCELGLVDMIQFASHADVVDFPMPCPELIAWRIGPTALSPSKPRARTSSPISCRSSPCQSSGPAYASSGVCGSPHGYALM